MRKGFTLIEVLVVAVIVAILAAVAIPAYMSYISGTHRDIAENTAATGAQMVAAGLARSMTEASAIFLMTSELKLPNTKYVLSVNGNSVYVTFSDARTLTTANVAFK